MKATSSRSCSWRRWSDISAPGSLQNRAKLAGLSLRRQTFELSGVVDRIWHDPQDLLVWFKARPCPLKRDVRWTPPLDGATATLSSITARVQLFFASFSEIFFADAAVKRQKGRDTTLWIAVSKEQRRRSKSKGHASLKSMPADIGTIQKSFWKKAAGMAFPVIQHSNGSTGGPRQMQTATNRTPLSCKPLKNCDVFPTLIGLP